MSTQPRKERRTLYNLPTHKARAKIASHLDEPLLLKYNTRSTTVRKGDTVRILRGEYAGHTGKVLEINTRTRKVTVDGVTVTKADSTQKPRPIDPSNVVITKLDLTDRLRREALGASDSDADEPRPRGGRAAAADAEREEKPAKAPKKAPKKEETVEEEA